MKRSAFPRDDLLVEYVSDNGNEKKKTYTQTHDASGAYMTTNELHQHTHATRDDADLSYADISEHDVLYRAAASRLT